MNISNYPPGVTGRDIEDAYGDPDEEDYCDDCGEFLEDCRCNVYCDICGEHIDECFCEDEEDES